MIKFRALRADEIEVRVSQVMAKGASFLLYKDARCDMNMLDETVGPFGWQRKHELINGKEFCTLSIKDPNTGEWISKQDCGTESNTEKEKGETSDALKRAAFNWGIGRELYTKIFIYIPGITEPDPKSTGRYKLKNPYEKYTVSEVTIDKDRQKITELKIVDSKYKEVFYWSEGLKQTRPKKGDDTPTKDTIKAENNFNKTFENELTKCDICGKQIRATTLKTAAEVAKTTKDRFGQKTCMACSKKLMSGGK